MVRDQSEFNQLMLEKVAAGDSAAFRQLFYAYHQRLGSYIFRITESRELTQEIVQDVFLKIWINRAHLEVVGSFESYLFVAARHHALNYLKKLAREKHRQQEWLRSFSGEAEPMEGGEDAGPEALIEQAIALLPPQQKKVYQLSREQGLQQKDIARELNISLETVKKHMVLAIRSLKDFVRTHMQLFSF